MLPAHIAGFSLLIPVLRHFVHMSIGKTRVGFLFSHFVVLVVLGLI